MKYLLLDGFPRGLDARKFNLSAPPGTLVELTNGHLTNGGEIEKRKAFVEFADVTTTETGAEATTGVRTFGIQETSVGVTVFGSALPFGTSPTLSQPVLSAAMPSGVTYQQLQHPAVTDGVTYDKTKHALTAVRSSCVYGGSIAALATFADGTAFGYYNGALIRDFTDGLRMAHLDNTVKLATALTEMVNRSEDYTAVQLANPNDHKVNITGQPAVVYDLITGADSDLGVIAAAKSSDPTPATAGAQAVAGFTVVSGSSGTVTVATTGRERASNVAILTIGSHNLIAGTRVTVTGLGGTGYNQASVLLTAVTATTISYANTGSTENGGAPGTPVADTGGTVAIHSQIVKVEVGPVGALVTITNGSVDWTTSNEVTAAAIAASINTATSSPDYTATASGSGVELRAALSVGDTPNNFEVKVTAAGRVCAGRSQFQVLTTVAFTNAVCHINGVNISGTVNWTTSASATATAIAAAINAGTNLGATPHGYVACATGAIITICKAVTSSSDTPVPIYFVTDPAGGIIEVDTGTGSLGTLEVTIFVTSTVKKTILQVSGYWAWVHYITVLVRNGLSPQEPVWQGATVNRIDASHFYVYNGTSYLQPSPPRIRCSVTDASGTVYSNYLV